MVNRLMDLVVLVAELSQQSDKSFKELDEELLHRGYSSEEIEEAFFWFSSQWRPIEHRPTGPAGAPVRVLSPWEAMGIDGEAYGYLLRLVNLGIIDDEQFEKIMARVHPNAFEKLRLGDIKAAAAAVIFHTGQDDSEDDLFDVVDDDIPLT